MNSNVKSAREVINEVKEGEYYRGNNFSLSYYNNSHNTV
ncbi:protein of unknown function [Clostridium beijerinckii]|nr:protein of unknown function [Clostridium beijerinckii]